MLKSRKGFSLMELVAVIALIAVLTGIVSFNVVSLNNSNKLKALEVAQRTIVTGLEKYKLVTGHYPTSQTEFEAFLKNTNYFSAVPVNPFWADTQHPEKGWLWNPTLQTVEPVR